MMKGFPYRRKWAQPLEVKDWITCLTIVSRTADVDAVVDRKAITAVRIMEAGLTIGRGAMPRNCSKSIRTLRAKRSFRAIAF